ncbi:MULTISPECIES: class I SAM-dependent methyltransferase [Nocardia]|uniref:class I SAM-dependent methyltransferase n=1 Tax=Nocardia TaxID=1817 RepID=UPI0020BEA697|nr:MULTISPECIES: methyltransferase domain-containing protein [Nocardia]
MKIGQRGTGVPGADVAHPHEVDAVISCLTLCSVGDQATATRPARRRAVSTHSARPNGILGRLLGRLWIYETAAINDQAIALLAASPGDSVLDIGCGPGRAVAEIARRGARVTGIAPASGMIAEACRRNAAAILAGQVDVLHGHAGALPVPEKSYQAALTVHTIYFWDDLDAGLREIRRVPTPGGRLVVAFRPAEHGLPRRLDPQVYRGPTTNQLTDALRQSGFTRTTVEQGEHTTIVVSHVPDDQQPEPFAHATNTVPKPAT